MENTMKADQLRVQDLMTPQPTALTPRHHLRRAAEELRLGRIRHLPVVDPHGLLVGVITHRDLLEAGDDLGRPIAEVMQTDVKTIAPAAPAREAAYLILRHAIGCVPVVEGDGRLCGIVTDTDFVRVAYTLLGGAVPVDQIELEEREAENV
jgi:CBS domain-containing membrane protein